MLRIEIANRQKTLPIDRRSIRTAVERILRDHEVREAQFSIAFVDAAVSERVNREFLDHEGPADVISFPLAQAPGLLEGELVVCPEVAVREAAHYGWSAAEELLLYVIHGTLHLVGYDDLSPGPRRVMRAEERRYLAQLGIEAVHTPRKKPAAAKKKPAAVKPANAKKPASPKPAAAKQSGPSKKSASAAAGVVRKAAAKKPAAGLKGASRTKRSG